MCIVRLCIAFNHKSTSNYFYFTLAGIWSWVSIGNFIEFNIDLKSDTVFSESSHYEIIIPWPLVITSFGGMICFVVASLNVVLLVRNRKLAVSNAKVETDSVTIIPRKSIRRSSPLNQDCFNITVEVSGENVNLKDKHATI